VEPNAGLIPIKYAPKVLSSIKNCSDFILFYPVIPSGYHLRQWEEVPIEASMTFLETLTLLQMKSYIKELALWC
jgi:hypothetical protein